MEREHVLARHVQHAAARDEDRETRRARNERCQPGGGTEDVLEVVEDEQELLVLERLRQRIGPRHTRELGHLQRRADRLDYE